MYDHPEEITILDLLRFASDHGLPLSTKLVVAGDNTAFYHAAEILTEVQVTNGPASVIYVGLAQAPQKFLKL